MTTILAGGLVITMNGERDLLREASVSVVDDRIVGQTRREDTRALHRELVSYRLADAGAGARNYRDFSIEPACHFLLQFRLASQRQSEMGVPQVLTCAPAAQRHLYRLIAQQNVTVVAGGQGRLDRRRTPTRSCFLTSDMACGAKV